jgi:nucleotide-binding universal stress UspA family protein
LQIENFEPKNLLVPIDFSPQSRKALEYARLLAERLGTITHHKYNAA